MINCLQLQNLKETDITLVDRKSLVDIRDIKVDSLLPEHEKIVRYIEQIKNPYCFLCGGTPVKIRFVSENKTLKKSLSDYFRSLK